MTDIDRRSRIILALSLLFFVSGLLFFVLHGKSAETTREVAVRRTGSETASSQSLLKKMPPPASFQSFVYDEQSRTVTGECGDTYYVVLVYPAAIDYREDPLSAKFNAATACVSGEAFEVSVDLANARLVVGDAYYLIRAHQGATGSWYNPY